MKKYSKGQLKFKRFGLLLAILLVLVLAFGLLMLFGFCLKHTINITNTSNEASNVSEEIAQNSQPIIIDNLVVGGLYGNKWVSSSKYYLKSINKANIDINVYTKDKSAGAYKLESLYTYGDSVFCNTSYPNYIDEFFAISTQNYALSSNFSETSIQESDYDYVKKALGIYRAYNNTINITNVYSAYINVNEPLKLITVTSNQKGAFGGVYNGIIAVVNGNAKIVQYSYTKDLDNSLDFPLYSVEFVADLNGDGNSEIVTREVTEFNVTYNIFEKRGSKYVRVLTETIKGK